jgi:hypothetical protein
MSLGPDDAAEHELRADREVGVAIPVAALDVQHQPNVLYRSNGSTVGENLHHAVRGFVAVDREAEQNDGPPTAGVPAEQPEFDAFWSSAEVVQDLEGVVRWSQFGLHGDIAPSLCAKFQQNRANVQRGRRRGLGFTRSIS